MKFFKLSHEQQVSNIEEQTESSAQSRCTMRLRQRILHLFLFLNFVRIRNTVFLRSSQRQIPLSNTHQSPHSALGPAVVKLRRAELSVCTPLLGV